MWKILLVTLAFTATFPVFDAAAEPADDTGKPAAIEEVFRTTGGDWDSLRRYVYHILQDYDAGATLEYSRGLYRLGKEHGDPKSVVYGAAVAGMNHVFLRNRDSAYMYASEAVEVGEEIDYQWGLASAYNGMGMYMLNFGDSNYYTAMQYFARGLEAAKKGNNRATYVVILTNIATVYFLRGDVKEGLPYAQECYETAVDMGDEYLIFAASCTLASLYYNAGYYERALEMIRASEKMVLDSSGEANYPSKAIKVFTHYGNILAAMGRDAQAVHYFEKALALEDVLYGDLMDFTYLSYGDYFMKRERYRDALRMFLAGIRLSADMDNKVYLNQFYQKASESYEKLGEYVPALRYHKSYYELSQNIFSLEKERSVSEMRVRYEVEKKEAEIARNRLQLLQQKRRSQIVGLVAVAVLLALFGILYYYRRKNQLYREIFRQSQLAVKARSRLEYEKYSGADPFHSEKYASSPLSDSKGKELFDRLELLMVKDKLYLDGKLSVDKLAETVGSNRSYLSRIINEYSGYNFNNFVNSYRVNEAVRILSDPEADIPLKALATELGYNTLTTFYSSFQREMGMPPSRYRKMVLENGRTLR